MKRPEKKIDAKPLTEEDKYSFLPYALDDGLLPSERNSWKTDAVAVSFINALKEGKDVSTTDWSGINLKGADLSGFDLSGVNLSKANLTGVKFHNTNLKGANLSYAYMEATDMTNANLKDVDFKGVFFKDCLIDGADIDEEKLAYLHSIEWLIEQIEAGKIDLRSIPQNQINFLDLRMLDLSKVDTSGIDLSALVLTGVNLSGARINKGHLLNMDLFEKQKEKFEKRLLISDKEMELKMKKMAEERKEKLKSIEKENLKRQYVKSEDYCKTLTRPVAKKSIKKNIKSDKKVATDVDAVLDDGVVISEDKTPQILAKKTQRVRLPKRHIRKRAG